MASCRLLLIKSKKAQELQVRAGEFGGGKLLYSRRERVILPLHVGPVVEGLLHQGYWYYPDDDVIALINAYYAPQTEEAEREYQANYWRFKKPKCRDGVTVAS